MTTKPAVIVISSHVVRGTVGNRAAAFALEVLGFPVWIVPTITLAWHPGQGSAGRMVPDEQGFDRLIDDLCNAPWLGEVGAVLSGYLGNAAQVNGVSRLVEAVKAKRNDAVYVLDPVMGDHGRLYVSQTQAEAMREHLLPLADIVTPNPFELSFLTEREWHSDISNPELIDLAKSLKVTTVMTTSAQGMMKNHIANILVEEDKAWLAEHRLADGPPNGLGDLAAALFLAHTLAKAPPQKALSRMTASLHEVMGIAAKAQSSELLLEASISSIIRPRTEIDARALMSVRKAPKRDR